VASEFTDFNRVKRSPDWIRAVTRCEWYTPKENLTPETAPLAPHSAGATLRDVARCVWYGTSGDNVRALTLSRLA